MYSLSQTYTFSLSEMGRSILNRGMMRSYILKGSMAARLKMDCWGQGVKGRSEQSVQWLLS